MTLAEKVAAAISDAEARKAQLMQDRDAIQQEMQQIVVQLNQRGADSEKALIAVESEILALKKLTAESVEG